MAETEPRRRIAVLTASDSAARGLRADRSGVLLASLAARLGDVTATAVEPDDFGRLRARLEGWIREGMDLILTTGGTGLGPRDVMPEVTRALVRRPVPGLAEALRQESARHTPTGWLSRGEAGVAGRSLIINLPGSPAAVEQLWPLLEALLPHALELLHGHTAHDPAAQNPPGKV
ncbi:Molybdenum cofactor biosynthesis protein [Candidatus Hydrogenisulfobacillus filiaventi]|uniref:Molybdenum cofactor biosynthesis protein n=1 Tax=Candidatus Hydrogenisulfobacillus filiaventi TaxID=2707344 RepID=A0A6F8ZIJ7_9FIRM|nr:MogA/MoaB family molybdenum cofactor biosynthesis protein [Bacillota bacterium]CAB1129271.1 Molybdenum cofactor biosynthesis protein [Candidatus Hydrogenisulfobacillus filiaventi]